MKKRRSSERGLTLVECLVAIAIIAIVGVAIAPTVLLAAATRVQNQRAERSIQLAQGEIDRIRLLIEREQYTNANLPLEKDAPPIQNTSAPAAGAAGRTLNPATDAITLTKGLAVDVERARPCNPVTSVPPVPPETCDFVVQTFRDAGVPESTTIATVVGFRMGVRVYDFQAFAANQTLQPEQLSLSVTSGQDLQRPLAVFYTTLYRSDRDFSLCR